jgi:hypothetical protein
MDPQDQAQNFARKPGAPGNDMWEISSLYKEGHQVLYFFPSSVCRPDQIRLEKQHHKPQLAIGRIDSAMIQVAPNHHHVVFVDLEESILDLKSGLAGCDTVNLAVLMTIHPNAIAAAKAEEADINGKGGVKRIEMRPFRVDLRFNYSKAFFPSWGDGVHFHLPGDSRATRMSKSRATIFVG